MKVAVILVVATLCALLTPALGGWGKGKGMHKKKCGDEELVAKEAFKGMKECFKKPNKNTGDGESEAAPEGEERRRRSPHEGGKRKGKGKRGKWGKRTCSMVCQWKIVGLLSNDTGSFNEDGAKDYVDRVYPEKFRSAMFEKVKACSSENSDGFSMENNCGGYKPFAHCVFKSHMEVCGNGKGKGKKDPNKDMGGETGEAEGEGEGEEVN